MQVPIVERLSQPFPSPISYLLSPISYLLSPISCLLSLVSCLLSLIHSTESTRFSRTVFVSLLGFATVGDNRATLEGNGWGQPFYVKRQRLRDNRATLRGNG